jgi:TrmH family RNA methyltransferase
MITVKKIYTLKPRTQVRKVSSLFYDAARSNGTQNDNDVEYLKDVFLILHGDAAKTVIPEKDYERISKFEKKLNENSTDKILYEDIAQFLLSILGAEPSDWDFVNEHGELDSDRREIMNHSLILDRLRSPFNVGAVFRSADSFGIKSITLVEGTASVDHPRSVRTSRGTIDTVDHNEISEEELIENLKQSGRPLFALELGGTDIEDFDFPSDGIAVIGSEEFGVSEKLLNLCDKSLGRVSIPLAGSKGSINVSVSTGIMLQAWYSREKHKN